MPEIEGYTVVPLRLTPTSKHGHNIYMREHFIRLMDPNKPKHRTLFLLNVPPYVTEDSLQTFFNKCNPVTSVAFAVKPGREETNKWYANIQPFSNSTPPFIFKVAYVVFQNAAGVARALALQNIDLFNESTSQSLIESGMQLWHSEHEKTFLKQSEAQERIDKLIADYDRREAKAFKASQTSVADTDGWVTVGKQGRNAGFEQKESVIDRLEDKIDKSKRTKELSNFYTFQIRESKMKNIIELRQKFEEDKRKIETLKQTRRFRPF